MRIKGWPRWLPAAGALLLVATGCGASGDEGSGATSNDTAGTLTIYSGREEEFVAPLFEAFEADTGIALDVRYGDSSELAVTILEEGDGSPADVFFSQDAGSLGAVAEAGLFAPVDPAVLDRVETRFQSADGLWVGTSGRGRVAVYNIETVDPAELPASILGFAEPEWAGLIGLPPTNSSFQAHVAAMMLAIGEAQTREWLQGLVDNGVRAYEDNGSTTRAVAAGEIEVGLVNHYYKYEVEAEDGTLPIANHYFAAGDPGAFINVAGVGILATAPNADAAAEFVSYLTGEPGQTFVAEQTWEYPVVAGFEPSVDLIPLSEFVGPDVDLSSLGQELPAALNLLAEVGLL